MRQKLRSRFFVAAATFGVAVLVYSLLVLFQRSDFQDLENERLHQADLIAFERLTRAEEEVLRQNAFAVALSDQVKALGERPVVNPPSVSPYFDGNSRSTQRQILDAVAAALPEVLRTICGGVCNGKTGEEGPAGPPGPAGQPGKDGSPGAPGEDGRGISHLECISITDFTVIVEYSDGTRQTVVCTAPEE